MGQVYWWNCESRVYTFRWWFCYLLARWHKAIYQTFLSLNFFPSIKWRLLWKESIWSITLFTHGKSRWSQLCSLFIPDQSSSHHSCHSSPVPRGPIYLVQQNPSVKPASEGLGRGTVYDSWILGQVQRQCLMLMVRRLSRFQGQYNKKI